MNESRIVELEKKHMAATYAKKPLTIVKGRGTKVWDAAGKPYLDLTGSYGVCILGHCHPKIMEAVNRQVMTLISCHASAYNDARSEFLEKLASIAPKGLDHAFLSNSGTEAVECAIKLARKFSGKKEIIAMMNGFHGKTMGSLSATWDKKYRQPFEPLVPGFKHVPYGNAARLAEAIDPETAAVIIEPIQGEGGIKVPPADYLPAVRDICREKEILLIADEVQTGFGRTGKKFACEHSSIIPDIVCLGKAIAGGLPLAVTLARAEIMESLKLGEHTSTFGGNPLVCAAGTASIEVLVNERLDERAAKLGSYFINRLQHIGKANPIVREVRGKGLMIGTELRFDVLTIIQKALQKSLIILDAGRNVLRFLPPLVIEKEEIDEAAATLGRIIGEENNARLCTTTASQNA